MENVIEKLLHDFEQGRMNRRQLIQMIAVTAAAAPARAAAPAMGGGHGFKATALNHISYQVADYARTRDFYADLLGMKVMQDDGKRQCELVFGPSFIIPRNPFQPGMPTPHVDHFAITIADWNKDAVEEELKRRGYKKKTERGFGLGAHEYRPDTDNSFHLSDPDGFDLQIAGEEMKP